MKKIIRARLLGDWQLVLEKWKVPERVECKQSSPNVTELSFLDDNIPDFYELEKVTERLGGVVELKSRFHAHSFTQAECLSSELLAAYFTSQRGFDARVPGNIQELRARESIDMVSHYSSLEGWVAATESGLKVFHKCLVEELESKGLTSGLQVMPTFIEISGHGSVNDWLGVFSTIDLGQPIVHRRFIQGFQKSKWKGEDFCTSSFYDWEILFISQRVFRFLDALPEDRKGKIEFEPVELLD